METSGTVECSKYTQKKNKQNGSKRILVMDDNEMIRNLISQMLNLCGFETITVQNGAKAVEQYRKKIKYGYPFDAVILDINVPNGMGGKDAIVKLLEIDHNVKAIVSSADYSDPAMTRFKDYGFIGSLPKPYSVFELMEALDEAIKK